MRARRKLIAVTVTAVAVAAASPFFVDSLRVPSGATDAVTSAGSSIAATVSAVWSQVVAASPGGGAAAADGTAPGATIQIAQVTPRTTGPAVSVAPRTTTPAQTGGGLSLSQGDMLLVMTLLRNTLVAVHQANLTGNYTVLRDLGAPAFRDSNTAGKLAELFAPVRSRGIDLSTVVLLDPKLTVAKVNDQGLLNIVGAVPTQPAPVNFDLLYQGVANSWQLFAVTIIADTAQATAGSAPTPAVASAPAAPTGPVIPPAPQATISAAPKPAQPPPKPVIPPLPTTRP